MKPIPIETNGWEYHDTCNCDEQFIEYLETILPENPQSFSIFHMGPGLHHKIGLWAITQPNIFVRSITLTPKEVEEYIRLATENPILNRKYKVDFGDIHLIHPSLLQKFDFISLFHLGEISMQVMDPDYPGRSIEEVISILTKRLAMGGEMLFYERSVAWETIRPVIELNLDARYKFKKIIFKDLVIYRKGDH